MDLKNDCAITVNVFTVLWNINTQSRTPKKNRKQTYFYLLDANEHPVLFLIVQLVSWTHGKKVLVIVIQTVKRALSVIEPKPQHTWARREPPAERLCFRRTIEPIEVQKETTYIPIRLSRSRGAKINVCLSASVCESDWPSVCNLRLLPIGNEYIMKHRCCRLKYELTHFTVVRFRFGLNQRI